MKTQTLVTIPKNIAKMGELVILPRKTYEELVGLKKKMASIFKPTELELRALEKGRKDFKNGNFIEWMKLRDELDSRHRRPSRKTA